MVSVVKGLQAGKDGARLRVLKRSRVTSALTAEASAPGQAQRVVGVQVQEGEGAPVGAPAARRAPSSPPYPHPHRWPVWCPGPAVECRRPLRARVFCLAPPLLLSRAVLFWVDVWVRVQQPILARAVLIATGGYASDFTNTSLLKQYRPDLIDLPTTNGAFTTGDGIKLALSVGADVVDMANVQVCVRATGPCAHHPSCLVCEHRATGAPCVCCGGGVWVTPLQVHPTGFVDPKHPDHKVKTLCAELLRGVGGVLLDASGRRFANELGTRDYIVSRWVAARGTRLSPRAPAVAAWLAVFVRWKLWRPRCRRTVALVGRGVCLGAPVRPGVLFTPLPFPSPPPHTHTLPIPGPALHSMRENARAGPAKQARPAPWFTLLLNGAHASIADKHVPMYVAKGLLTRVDTLQQAASEMGVDAAVLVATLQSYEAAAAAGYVLHAGGPAVGR
jgi:hypothetical protein